MTKLRYFAALLVIDTCINQLHYLGVVVDNSVTQPVSIVSIAVGGTISVGVAPGGGSWTASGAKSLVVGTLTYKL